MNWGPVFNHMLGLVALFGVSSALLGCRTSPKMMDEIATAQPVAAEPTKPITFTDKAELQSGTGAIDADAPKEFSKTESGLRYRVLRKSDGKKPLSTNTVTVNYRGWLNNGKVFDSSYERGEPTSFPLDGVVAGWTEGLQLVGAGGMIELWVPSSLGYGAGGSPGSIPPHATLHFVVELLQVK